jgi:hypothetical protein
MIEGLAREPEPRYAIRRRNQGWHDKVGRTLVIRRD